MAKEFQERLSTGECDDLERGTSFITRRRCSTLFVRKNPKRNVTTHDILQS